VDQETLQYSQTLSIKRASPDNIPWRYLGECEHSRSINAIRCVLLTWATTDKYRILEDGSQTQHRLCVIESALPPHSDGPVFHFHEMHDEGFYVTVLHLSSHLYSNHLLTHEYRKAESAFTHLAGNRSMPVHSTSSPSQYVFHTSSATPSTKKPSSSTPLLPASSSATSPTWKS
jgi:hypothetical protein